MRHVSWKWVLKRTECGSTNNLIILSKSNGSSCSPWTSSMSSSLIMCRTMGIFSSLRLVVDFKCSLETCCMLVEAAAAAAGFDWTIIDMIFLWPYFSLSFFFLCDFFINAFVDLIILLEEKNKYKCLIW